MKKNVNVDVLWTVMRMLTGHKNIYGNINRTEHNGKTAQNDNCATKWCGFLKKTDYYCHNKGKNNKKVY